MKYEITKEQEKEFKSIHTLLNSIDQESILLGIGLLRSYPCNMRCILFENFYSQKLGLLLYQYDVVSNNIWKAQFWVFRLIAFVNGILKNKIYFT